MHRQLTYYTFKLQPFCKYIIMKVAVLYGDHSYAIDLKSDPLYSRLVDDRLNL